VARLKGKAEMQAGNKSRMHELAAALRKYSERNQKFPRGTAARDPAGERNGIPWAPDQCVSWLVELLPYLGQGEFEGLAKLIDRQKSWRDPENLLATQALVPHFLGKDSPEDSWWVDYPRMRLRPAATHWVGVAGVGMDAPDYDPQDPGVRAKLGIFGYDRETKVADVKDGLGNTIAMLQVPLTLKRPWLAGGGATVQGVPETESIKPFVCAEYNGRRGTYAIMADGKVRFIPETISDKDFQALCTIAGGEQVEVDKVAPLVGGQTELKPQLPGQAPPAPKNEGANPPAPPAAGPPPPAAPPAPPAAPPPPANNPAAPAPKEEAKPAGPGMK
jgi:hypothetical protein